jgi:hypothetical protein
MKILRTIWLVEIREGLQISIEAYTSTPAMEGQLTTLIIRCSCTFIPSIATYPGIFGSGYFLQEDEVLDIAEKYCQDQNIETDGQ